MGLVNECMEAVLNGKPYKNGKTEVKVYTNRYAELFYDDCMLFRVNRDGDRWVQFYWKNFKFPISVALSRLNALPGINAKMVNPYIDVVLSDGHYQLYRYSSDSIYLYQID